MGYSLWSNVLVLLCRMCGKVDSQEPTAVYIGRSMLPFCSPSPTFFASCGTVIKHKIQAQNIIIANNNALWVSMIFQTTMRNQQKIISSIVLLFISSCYAADWPSDIKRCSINSTDEALNKCLLEVAIDTIPKIINGHPGLGFVPLDPLKFTNMTVSSDRPAIKLHCLVPNGTIEGIGDVIMKNISYDKNEHIFTIDGTVKKLKMSGKYQVRGKLLFLTLQSHGLFDMVIENLNADAKVKLTPSRKKGFYRMNLGYKLGKIDNITVKLDDAVLPDAAESALTEIVNENWEIISDAFAPTMERAVLSIFKPVMKPFFKKFPLSTIFPDKL